MKPNMVAYEFYLKGGTEEDNLIGILPERRKDRKRVNRRSIMRWGKLAAGNCSEKGIYYVRVNL